MLDRLLHSFCRSPRRLVLLGLWCFFLGAVLLLGGALVQITSLQELPLPQSPLGFTASASLVCWGVWAMGAGLRRGRDGLPSGEPAVRSPR